ncbi:NAD-dependent succinate-semialdehyde dehydrogenase [Microbacterium pygmaeum]|uniref:Succinate-semialdehyde dehydrogenase / glutarate-semialdehyde dehydrogenase n=1 Tax=Microbacterium pygmaeum TaxID=370764 RepID=A0A1G7YNC5_9MICO|nr:NAD-dependent succinate-semialdehyde dehydrogenase [Microbacterium pygmaeum]SDG97937.1 succinate-semialdehyde dehydrogenase / glutarate-semialdehyde dehydrogenase [Microbacterium pygmaeum]
MTLHDRLFIAGTWRASSRTASVHDPSDGSVLANVAIADDQDLDDAVNAAATSFPAFAATPARERAEMLRRAFEIMSSEIDAIATIVSQENGKVLADAIGEVTYAAEFLRWFSEEAVRVSGDFRASPSGDKTIIVTHDPVGPSLLITPWNFPAAMVTRKIGPALAAGCTVVLKPALETPLTALAIADVFDRAGVPPGVINVVIASPAGPAVSRMLADSRIRNLSFTGSTEVGKLLIRQSAEHVLRTSMELGGNAPFLVLEDADLDEAVRAAMVAKLRNGGAACTAANRFYIARPIAAEFARRLADAMTALRTGPGLGEGVQLGASVSVGERDKIARLVDGAVADGGVTLTGGVVPDGLGAFYPPTVLTVDADNPILDVEIFGPVAPVVAVDSDDEAIRLANASAYGLISYVFGGDLRRTLAVAKRLEAGMVAVNRGVISDPAAPFGGVKESGVGREGGFAGIHEFLESKYIGVEL